MAFARFTDRARAVMDYARDEALRAKHRVVEAEDILLGILREGSATASLDVGEVRAELEKRTNPNEDSKRCDRVSVIRQGSYVVESAIKEALTLGHDYIIDAGHLLLGLLSGPANRIVQLFEDLGLDVDSIRNQTEVSLRRGGCGETGSGTVSGPEE